MYGADISKKILTAVEEKSRDYVITYQRSVMGDLQFFKKSLDVVISSPTFHYVEDFKQLIAAISTWPTPKGSSIFSVEHPVFTVYDMQDWCYAENGEILHLPTDNYHYEGRREADFLGERVVKHHHTLTTYLSASLCSSFELQHIIEPQPPEHMLDTEGMRDEMCRPMILLIVATKC